MESIADYVASGNFEALDDLAKNVIGVEDGAELAEKFPDGWVVQRNGEVFDNKNEAITHDWNNEVDQKRAEAREALRQDIEGMRYQVAEQDQYNRMLYPDGNIPTEGADSSELEYSDNFPMGGTDMRETTYQYRDPTGVLENNYFSGDHFPLYDREENLVAHARAAEFPVEGGGTAYHLGEAQSDVQQAMRNKVGPTRTRAQEVNQIKRDELERQVGSNYYHLKTN